MSHIFISYSRKDLVLAEKIIAALAKDDLEPWIDWKSIPKGEQFEREIQQGIEGAEVFLFLVSPDSAQSDWCNEEIDHAIQNGKRILPIVIRDTDPKIIHPEISKRNWIFCREGQDDFNKAIVETRKTIHTDYEWLKYHTKLQVKALDWERKKDNSRLLRGKELREAEQQLAEVSVQEDPQPTKIQREYILASQRDEVQSRRRVTMGLGFGLVVVMVLAIFAWMQRNEAVSQATISRARELAALSTAQRNQTFDLSLLLSIEAFHKADTVQTRSALLDGVETNSKLIRHLSDGDNRVISVAFSPDGNLIASGNIEDGVVNLWDMKEGRIIASLFDERTSVRSIDFSPDGKYLAMSGLGRVTLWDVSSKKEFGKPLISSGFEIDSVKFSPDGNLLATAGGDGTILLWDVATQTQIGQPFIGHSGSIFCIDFSPDGKFLASGGFDKSVILWDVNTHLPIGQPLIGQRPLTNFAYSIFTVAFSPDGALLASGDTDGRVILWDVSALKPVGTPLVGHTDMVSAIEFFPDGKRLASGSSDNTVIIWNTTTHEIIDKMSSEPGSVDSLSINPDGNLIAAGGCGSVDYLGFLCSRGQIKLWAINMIQPISDEVQEQTSESSFEVSFTQDSRSIALGGKDNSIILWDIASREPIGWPLVGHTDLLNTIAISPNGNILASGGRDNKIILWNLATQEPIGKPLGSENATSIFSLAFSPDSKMLASGAEDGTIMLWDVKNGIPIGMPLKEHYGPVLSMKFSPDGNTLTSCGLEGNIISWSVTSHEPKNYLHEEGGGCSLDISSNGKMIASVNNGATIFLRDAKTLQPIGQPLIGNKSVVFNIAFSPDGKTLASGNYEGIVILWDVETHKAIGQPLVGNSNPIVSLDISPNGLNLVTIDDKGKILLWDISPQSWVEQTCKRVGRNFTRAEWALYFPNDVYRATCTEWAIEPEIIIAPTP